MRAPSSLHVARPVMYHQWSEITFLHWRCPPAVVQALVPGSLTVETFDGSAWVGLTPFLMEGVRVPGLPAVPWLSRFPETNVRTYVRDDLGRRGIWFLSLDAGRLTAALGGRAGFWLPYFWSDMSVRVGGGRVRYRCRRHGNGARCDAEVATGPLLPAGEVDELALFLTARYRLFTVVAGRTARARVEHPPWPLRRAELTRLDQDLVQAAGLPAPQGPPVVHASSGVPVRVGMWTW
ncbi:MULTISPECIES: YqjF family protein [unclassified Nonomuraea]|uniref:YqjF family protein n=1 Tax=unclassified Nonomuraea TaxID=2593643 RepID=UPI00342538AC